MSRVRVGVVGVCVCILAGPLEHGLETLAFRADAAFTTADGGTSNDLVDTGARARGAAIAAARRIRRDGLLLLLVGDGGAGGGCGCGCVGRGYYLRNRERCRRVPMIRRRVADDAAPLCLMMMMLVLLVLRL